MEQKQQQKMATPSHQHAPSISTVAPAAVEEKEKEKEKEKEEVCKTNKKIPWSCAAAGDDLCCLSGEKPFFDIILSKSHLLPHYSLKLPARAVNNLPPGEARVVITHGNRKWNLSYNGSLKRPMFVTRDWKRFVEDNNLKHDDACIFQVMESSPTAVELKALFLRKTKCLPPQLRAENEAEAEAEAEPHGRTAETAIELD